MKKYQLRIIVSGGLDDPHAIFSGLEGFSLISVQQMPVVMSHLQQQPVIRTVYYLQRDITDMPDAIKELTEAKEKYEKERDDLEKRAGASGLTLSKGDGRH